MTCPHCHLPAVMPEKCTPELHDVIEQQITRDWDLYNAGWEAGRRAEREWATANRSVKAEV